MSGDSAPMDEQEVIQPDSEDLQVIGRTLRDAREEINLSLEHAARQLHLDVKLLKALEEEDFAALPGTAYAYGYLRSYAKLLKLPEEDILQSFLQLTQMDSNALIPEHMTFSAKNKVPSFSFRQTLLVTFLLVIVFSAVAWVMFSDVLKSRYQADSKQESTLENVDAVIKDESASSVIETIEDGHLSIEERQQAAMPDSVQVKQIENVTVPVPPKALQLSYKADSWTEVRDASNETLIYRMVKAGERLELEGKAPYTILLGYASGVTVTYKEKVFETKPYQRDDIAYFRLGQESSSLATEE